jgi:hypothetical protein
MTSEERSSRRLPQPVLSPSSEPQLQEGSKSDQDKKDIKRRLSALVAASHRKNRTSEKKRESAEKASVLHQEVTGFPLEINDDGEVIVSSQKEF